MLRFFFHRDRLSRKGRLFYANPVSLDKSKIGRHHISGLQQHNVSLHQLLRSDLCALPFPQHDGLRGRNLLKRLHGLPRFSLLDNTHCRIQHHHRDNDDGVSQLMQHERDRHRHHKDQDQRIVQLLGDHLPQALLLLTFQPVSPVFCPALHRLSARKALILVRLKHTKRVRCRLHLIHAITLLRSSECLSHLSKIYAQKGLFMPRLI